jgi:hypothetical protein
MLTFLRKIRKSLIETGSVRKYLLYAIGEIALVVIGILIALQINNWNETKKNEEKEVKILTNLRADFTATKNNLIEAHEKYSRLLAKLDGVLKFIAFDQDTISEGMKDSMRFTGMPIIKIVDGGLNSLLNSEKLELITNDSLNLLLTEYPSYVKSFKEQEKNMEGVLINLHRPILVRHVILMDVLSRRKRFPEFKNRVPTSDYFGLIRDRDYHNVIYDERAQTLNARNRANELRLKTEKVIGLISKQLKKN